MSDAFLTALENTLTLKVLVVILVSASYGLFVGAIPGLTATMAVALMVPFTFFRLRPWEHVQNTSHW